MEKHRDWVGSLVDETKVNNVVLPCCSTLVQWCGDVAEM